MNMWTTAFGAWGDVFAAYGNIKKLLQEKEQEKANVVYFGMDANINKFLMAQPDIDKVSHLLISEPQQYQKYAYMAVKNYDQFKVETGLAEQLPDLIPTHVTRYYQVDHPTECNRYSGCQLPPCSGDWQPFLDHVGPYLLVQPFSVQSCTYEYHWKRWSEAIEWLCENSPIKIVLVGQLSSESDPKFHFPWFESPNLTNLVGQVETMSDVLHIANWSKGIVTTSNCMAMWSLIQNIPALVMNNRIIQERPHYYRNWINAGSNRVLPWESTLEDFQQAFASQFDLSGFSSVVG